MKPAQLLILCGILSASLFATSANASCGNGGGQPSNGCNATVNAPQASTAAAATANASASTNVGVWSNLRQDQLQAQQQVQQQVANGGAGGQGGNATASGGTANATGGSASAQGGIGNASATGGTGGNASGASIGDIRLDVANQRNPVSSAIAPSINATANCAIPIAGGMSFVGFSGSLGTVVLDENCVKLEQIKAIAAIGDPQAALEMMCANEDYRSTRERMGKPCLERNPKALPE